VEAARWTIRPQLGATLDRALRATSDGRPFVVDVRIRRLGGRRVYLA
jgi:hypothetical protein